MIKNLKTLSWKKLDWKKAERDLAQLQNDICIAYKIGDLDKMKVLQHRLVNSYAARAVSVRQVTSNQGKSTPGVDRIVWNLPELKSQAIHSLKHALENGYKAQALRKVYIPKPGTDEQRPLSIPTMFDRAMQALFTLALDPIVETRADPRSFGFRKGRSVHDAANYIRLVCGNPNRRSHVYEVDLEKYFDRISHNWILANVPIHRPILKEFLRAKFLGKDVHNHGNIERGVPQGGVISPSISNYVLDGLQEKLEALDLIMVRYADDLVILGKTKEALTAGLVVLDEFLTIRGISRNISKCNFTTIGEGFNFLGFHFREWAWKHPPNKKSKKLGQFHAKPSAANIERVKWKLSQQTKVIRKSASDLIRKLNPILRGWAEHYKTSSSTTAFKDVSFHTYRILARWIIRKHKAIPLRRMISRYFKTVRWKSFGKTRAANWVFYAYDGRSKNTMRFYHLFQIGAVRITNRTQIRMFPSYNPYLIDHAEYFLKRYKAWTMDTPSYNTSLSKIMRKQNFVCPVCKRHFDYEDSIEIHHIRPVSKGGTNRNTNLQALHQECHYQITHPILKGTR